MNRNKIQNKNFIFKYIKYSELKVITILAYSPLFKLLKMLMVWQVSDLNIPFF